MVQGFRSIASPTFALSSPLRALLHRRCHRVPRYDKRRPLGVNVKRMETGDGWGCTLKAEGGSKVASRLRAPAENPGAVAVNAALMADSKVACTPAGALVPHCTGSTCMDAGLDVTAACRGTVACTQHQHVRQRQQGNGISKQFSHSSSFSLP
jgi:hypothetical protein